MHASTSRKKGAAVSDDSAQEHARVAEEARRTATPGFGDNYSVFSWQPIPRG